MSDIVDKLSRREPRYRVHMERIQLTLYRRDGVDTFPGELLNISAGGAKMRVSEGFDVAEALAVRLHVPALQRTIEVAASVCWGEPAQGGTWVMGCAFTPTIPRELLQEFASAGVLERRDQKREMLSLSAKLKWELDADVCDVVIRDYSLGGGCCVQAKYAGFPGQRLLLTMPRPDASPVKICALARWQLEIEDGFLIGCEFLHHRDSLDLRDAAQAAEGKTAVGDSFWRRLIRRRESVANHLLGPQDLDDAEGIQDDAAERVSEGPSVEASHSGENVHDVDASTDAAVVADDDAKTWNRSSEPTNQTGETPAAEETCATTPHDQASGELTPQTLPGDLDQVAEAWASAAASGVTGETRPPSELGDCNSGETTTPIGETADLPPEEAVEDRELFAPPLRAGGR
ncbi:MAG: PilZ domain-containing protein, partial [Planctomycetales bacterium]|nr:PilZ domain-containing protein [Planctomycetales bacterium]